MTDKLDPTEFYAVDEIETIPPPPRAPAEFIGSQLPIGSIGEIGLRLAALSDGLFASDGALSRMEKRIEKNAADRHEEMMRGFLNLTNAVLELGRRADFVEEDIEATQGELRQFIDGAAARNGNGHDG